MAPDIDSDSTWTWAAMEPELSEQDKELRDRFVDEYLVDESATLAASRVGFQPAFAKEYGAKWIAEAYVQKRIKEKRATPAASLKEEEARLKLMVMRRLESEAVNLLNPAASRVSALAKLAAVLGMDAPIKTQQQVTHQGGVMMVPAIANLNDWERAASATQTALVTDARSDH